MRCRWSSSGPALYDWRKPSRGRYWRARSIPPNEQTPRPRRPVVMSSADCCLIDPDLQLGGLLRVLHAHRVRVEHRAHLPPNGIGRVVDLRTFAILLLDLPSSKPMCNEMNADVPQLLAAEAATAPLLLLRIHLDILEKHPRIEIPVHRADLTRVNTRSTSGAEHPPAVPDPRNPGPESELSRVCPDPCRDPGSLSP